MLNRIKRIIRPGAYDKLRKLPRYTEVDTVLFDRRIKIPDAASFLFTYREIFQIRIYEFLTDKTDPYVIDGGANIGLASIFFKRLYPQAKVVSFEPDRNIFKYLQHNTDAFGFDDIELVNKGLWFEEATLTFDSEGADAGRINAESESKNQIEVTSLRPYLERREEVDLPKLDIEGAEHQVINDCKDLLSRVKNIFIEYHSFTGVDQPLPEILTTLKASGFRIYIDSPGTKSKRPFLERKEYNGMDNQLNIFGFRQS